MPTVGNAEMPPIDDTCTMWPAALLAQERQRRLGDPERAEQVGLDLVADLGLAELLDHPELAVAGVVDHDVEAAEVLVGLLDGGEGRGAVGDVELRSAGRASPYGSTRSSRLLVSRAVAATESPRSSAAIAHSRPKPREVPVMNQVLEVISAPRELARGSFRAEG